MANLVLFFQTHFGEHSVMAFRLENGIITKPLLSPGLKGNKPSRFARNLMKMVIWVVNRDHGSKLGLALIPWHIGHFGKHFSYIILVGTPLPGVSSRIDSGTPPHGIHKEPRVIRERRKSGKGAEDLGLFERIGFKGIPILLNFRGSRKFPSGVKFPSRSFQGLDRKSVV